MSSLENLNELVGYFPPSGNPGWSEEEKDGKLEDAFQVFLTNTFFS